MPIRIETSGNKLRVLGRFELADLRRFSAALYSLTTKRGYEDISLDFADVSGAYPAPMAGVCVEALTLQERSVDFRLAFRPSQDSLGCSAIPTGLTLSIPLTIASRATRVT